MTMILPTGRHRRPRHRPSWLLTASAVMAAVTVGLFVGLVTAP